MSNIAVVVPTIRPESWTEFQEAWESLFIKHGVHLIAVKDGEHPTVIARDYQILNGNNAYILENQRSVMGKDSDLIYNLNDGVRNLGFALIAKSLPNVEYIITLDDDVRPLTGTDPIQEHLDALNMRIPLSWLSTASEYMRGFPYDIRDEGEMVLSHGVWEGVPDMDAPTQLYWGDCMPEIEFYKGPVPKGILFPMCIMNVAFKRKMLPYMYQAPAYGNYQRFSDIWGGINAKRAIDKNGWAAVTGYSTILHERASNVYTNLQKEARGIMLNEKYWKGEMDTMDAVDQDYFNNYHEKMKRWEKLITKWIK